MKLRNILVAGLSAVALASCSDYLDVDAPSKGELDYVYNDKTEVQRALNGVYASALADATFGNNFLTNFVFNSDVDFKDYNNDNPGDSDFRRFACTSASSSIKSMWDALYAGIERANLVIYNLENGSLLGEENDPDYTAWQMLGEAKTLRAIFYHELTWYFGDVPVSFLPSSVTKNRTYPVMDRTEMLTNLINDLKEVAEMMDVDYKATTETEDDDDENETITTGSTGTAETINKDAVYAMIARLAMTAGGYSLRPDGSTYGKMSRPANYLDFYEIAMDYSKRVIDRGNHHLSLPFHQVFVNQCALMPSSNSDDVIFELPFGEESTGRVGYVHGPTVKENNGAAPFAKSGICDGGANLNAIYRFLFDSKDVRRDFVNQLWYYTNDGKSKINNSRTIANGKWSKLWDGHNFGTTNKEKTGINYPLIRYADVLLTYAEAVLGKEGNLNGPNGAAAQAAIAEVRHRAFPNNPELVEPYIAAASADPKAALKMILDERKFEFAGENMRWRDLVRNNEYNISTYYTFLRYYAVAENSEHSSEYLDYVSKYDFGNETGYDNLPYNVWYKENVANNDLYTLEQFPVSDKSIPVVRFEGIWEPVTARPSWAESLAANYLSWYDETLSMPNTYMLYSLYGYIKGDDRTGNITINNNGVYSLMPHPSSVTTSEDLPVLRYILPYPKEVCDRSNGVYVNKYGYN